MDINTVAAYAMAAAAIIGAGEGLRRIVVGIYNIAKSVDQIHSTVTKELVPNGGGSLIDAVRRIDARLVLVEEAANKESQRAVVASDLAEATATGGNDGQSIQATGITLQAQAHVVGP